MSIIMATSRGPHSYERMKDKHVKRENVGGVATGLKNVMENMGGRWVCWGDGAMDSSFQHENMGSYTIDRIFLTQKEKKGYYDEYSNSILWPLFHYFREKIQYDSRAFTFYENVNRKFAAEIMNKCSPDDILWIHDYQLSLVPGMLRDSGLKNRIIFTWHIPWISSEFFSILPERDRVVRSIAQADSITFHTQEYCRNFISAYIRSTGTRNDIGRKVHAIPIGINYGKFNNFRKSSALRKEQRMSKVFSIDRLDYTKGLVKRIGAIEALIRKYPEYREKFTFIMIVTPSRANIQGYDELKNDLEMNVGRINGLYGSISWMPITYMYRKLSQTQLMNYYYNADVALITPLKDGLNLVAEEFVATTEKGALVISEFAGVADYLPHSIKVNPNSIEDISEKLKIALDMPEEEKLKRLNAMKEFVIKHDDRWWAKKVLGTVNL